MHINELRDSLTRDLARIDELAAQAETAPLSEELRTELTETETRADETLRQVNEASKREERKKEFGSIPAKEAEAKPEVRVEVSTEPLTYEKFAPFSVARDLWLSNPLNPNGIDQAAFDRVQRHRREAERAPEYREIRQAETRAEGVEYRVIPNRTDGQGGEFVPPLWLIDEYAMFLRAGRVTADLCRNLPLPGGTDSINIPVITTGTTVAAQTADGAAISNTELVTATVTAPVRTIAGYEDVQAQLIEQSPLAGGLDQLVFGDLAMDYAFKLDVQVLNGAGTSGTMKGILNATGINTATYTQASPTVITAYPFVMGSVSQVGRTRFLPASAIIMRPDRWFWFQGSVSTAGNPLVLSNMQGPYNAQGVVSNPALGQGNVGWLGGVPVYADPNIPNNVGGATNEDRIIAGRFEDALLFEGAPHLSVHPDVGSSTLTLRYRFYKYCAFTAERYPKAFGTSTGTGNIVTTVLAGY